MSTVAVAWFLLLAFSAFNLYTAYRLLKARNLTSLIWIPVVGTLIPVLLFAWKPGGLTLLSFPVLQSIAFYVLITIANRRTP
ncbi:hypothetical protein Mterra_01911 [Calidithermus terrae]|uniref:Uncharacterized protein n=1 Tax=Calidithermus terrae TaxID=1408545 RepID=A0A399EKY6_9DEIN|nr:hypothetical protein [Calidithermus terrae]RIH84638.1 hypothetical protein Mterra_01911 [Calidithermus terrae]